MAGVTIKLNDKNMRNEFSKVKVRYLKVNFLIDETYFLSLIYLLLMLLISPLILIFTSFLTLSSGSQTLAQFEREAKTKKITCERTTCHQLPADENMNCVNECTSAKCFNQVYGDEPLEDGEIDVKRAREFSLCVRQETLDKKRELLRPRKGK